MENYHQQYDNGGESYPKRDKKKGRRGNFDSSRDIDKDNYEYFQRVMENLETQEFEDEEEKAMFVENVFSQTSGQEIPMCANQLVSRVIEQLMPLASIGVRQRFMRSLSEDLRTVGTDAFASHVLQKLMLISTFSEKPKSYDENEDKDVAVAFPDFCTSWVLKVCKFMINNFEEFSTDICASHLLRTAFQCAGGEKLEEKPRKGQQNFQKFQSNLTVFETNRTSLLHNSETENDFFSVLKLADEKVKEIDKLTEKFRFETFSGVLQCLLLVTSKVQPRECKSLSNFIFKKMHESFEQIYPPPPKNADNDEGDENETEKVKVSTIFREDAPCRILETILEVSAECAPKVFNKISEKLFEQRLVVLSRLPLANFSVQKLLNFCKNKEKFESWYENELDPNMEMILASRNYGVILAITKACRRLGAKQAHFLTALMRCLHCYEPSQNQNHFVPLLVQMTPKENFDFQSQNINVTLHGSLILQELFAFNKPIKLVTSLLSLDGVRLRNLFCDVKGAHIADVFLKSQNIGEKSRDALVKNLQGQLVSLACSKSGSRALDGLWNQGSLKAREMIASELVGKEAQLLSNQFGKYIAYKAALSVFKRSKDQWKVVIGQQDKKRKVAEDFLSDLDSSTKVKKQQMSTKQNKISTNVDHHSTNKKSKLDEPEFVIDRKGDESLKVDSVEMSEPIVAEKKKEKKKKAKSYLDDL